MIIKDKWLISGFVDDLIPANVNLKQEIIRLKQEKNAIIMAHFS